MHWFDGCPATFDLFGSAVVSGTWTSGTITVPMTGTSYPTAPNADTPNPTNPNPKFGAFVLRKTTT